MIPVKIIDILMHENLAIEKCIHIHLIITIPHLVYSSP
jgi:hypothetical protein